MIELFLERDAMAYAGAVFFDEHPRPISTWWRVETEGDEWASLSPFPIKKGLEDVRINIAGKGDSRMIYTSAQATVRMRDGYPMRLTR